MPRTLFSSQNYGSGSVAFVDAATALTDRLGKFDRRKTFTVGVGGQTNFDLDHNDAVLTGTGVLVTLQGQIQPQTSYTLENNTGAGGVDRVVMAFTVLEGQIVEVFYKRSGDSE